MLEKIVTINMLYDFYGNLLPERQREYLRLYREENWSLSEIATEFGLTRQGVCASIKKAEHVLAEYEEKLELLARFKRTEQVLSRIDHALADLIDEYRNDEDIALKLSMIQKYTTVLGE